MHIFTLLFVSPRNSFTFIFVLISLIIDLIMTLKGHCHELRMLEFFFALEPTENSSRHHGFTRESRIFAGVSPLSTMALPSGRHFEFVDST